MTKKRKHPQSNSVKPIPSAQLNVRHIEKQLSRGRESAPACSIWNETSVRNTVPSSSEALWKVQNRCSSGSQTRVFSHQNRYHDRYIPQRTHGNEWMETWGPLSTPSDQSTSGLANKRSRLLSTSVIFDHNVNAGRSEQAKLSRQYKGKHVRGKVGRPPKTTSSSNNQVIKLPVIPVLKISLTDVRSFHDKRGDRKACSSRYRVTPYPFGERCFSSPQSLRKSHRGRRTPTSRSGSERSCQSRSPDKSKRYRHHRHRRRSRASRSSSSGICRCSCSSCQTCKKKTIPRSRSNSPQRRRRQSNRSLESCLSSRANSDLRKTKPPSSKEPPTDKTRQSPDAAKTVKNIIERVSKAFNNTKETKCSNDRVRKNVSSNNDLQKAKTHISRKSRSRSPKERRQHRKRPSTKENSDNNMMCRLM